MILDDYLYSFCAIWYCLLHVQMQAFFVEGQYYRAAGQYRRALLYFDYMFPDTEEEEEKMCKVRDWMGCEGVEWTLI